MNEITTIYAPEIQSISPMSLMQAAITSGADVDKLERLMAMEQVWNDRNARQEFIEAMGRFQADCPVVKATKKGHNNTYAPLPDIIAQTKALMTECGFSYRFEQSQTEKEITVKCVVTHKSGHSESTPVTGPADGGGTKSAIQAIGSAITYLRRYSLCGAFGIVTADPDHDGRMMGQAQAEYAGSAMIIQIMELIESTGSDESRVKAWVRKSQGWPEDAEFEFAQLNKDVASAVLSMLKRKSAKQESEK